HAGLCEQTAYPLATDSACPSQSRGPASPVPLRQSAGRPRGAYLLADAGERRVRLDLIGEKYAHDLPANRRGRARAARVDDERDVALRGRDDADRERDRPALEVEEVGEVHIAGVEPEGLTVAARDPRSAKAREFG